MLLQYNYNYYIGDTIHVPGSEDDLRLGSMHQQKVEGLEFPHSSMCACVYVQCKGLVNTKCVIYNYITYTESDRHTQYQHYKYKYVHKYIQTHTAI